MLVRTNTYKFDITEKLKQWKDSTKEHNAFTSIGKEEMEREQAIKVDK